MTTADLIVICVSQAALLTFLGVLLYAFFAEVQRLRNRVSVLEEAVDNAAQPSQKYPLPRNRGYRDMHRRKEI